MPAVLETDAKASLQRGLYRLWVDHVVWTREYIEAAVAGSEDASAAAGRLLRNQEDIGNALVPFYGEDAGAAVTGVLKQHIMIAVDLLDAAVKGDGPAFEAADKRWDENAAEIAALVSSVNPTNWPESDVLDLLNLHLSLTRREVVARLDKDWEKDVAAFDDILTEILTLADVLADGLIRQFPHKFGSIGNGVHAGAGNGAGTGGAVPQVIRWR